MNTKHKARFRDTKHVQINNYTFQSVNKFKYLGVLVSENSEIKSEIKTIITAAIDAIMRSSGYQNLLWYHERQN